MTAVHRIEASQLLPISLEEAWAFFADPRNLSRITPPDLDFRVTCGLPERIAPGMIITYTLRPLLGLRVGWVTEITHVEPGVRFVDDQRAGPYLLWHHEHTFTAAPGGVEVRDVVHYALPFGPLGRLVHALVVGARVRAIFAYRRRVLAERFGRPRELQGAAG
jgi:ligand-binding SRPBCC domain-containing protein